MSSSTPVPRTKFLLIKAPASSLYEEKFGGDRNVFTVPMYAARMMAKKIQVGAAVDCTTLDLDAFEPLNDDKGSRRYFHDTSEWDDFDIDYKELVDPPSKSTAGVIPSQETVDKFLAFCTLHWSKRPGTHIAIFDSRGGYGVAAYLCARYMCEKLRAPVHVALASLKEVITPCGLADDALLRDLQTRYKGHREWKLESIPSWWWPVDDDEDANADGKGDDDANLKDRTKPGESGDLVVVIPPFEGTGQPAAKRHKANEPRQPDPQLLRVDPDSPKYERAVTVVNQLTSAPCDQGLPFHPEVRIDTTDELAATLPNKQYKVTWKSTGRRGLLLILNEGVYFLENDESSEKKVVVSVVQGDMKFPPPNDPSKRQHRTLLDGTLVHDKEGDKEVPRFYATDILCHMGGVLMAKPFAHRAKYLLDGVVMARKKDTSHNYSKEAIKLRAKEFFEIERLDFVLKNVLRGVTHGCEGVVFVPLEGKYHDGGKVMVWEKSGNVSEESLVKHVSSLSYVAT